MITVTSGAGPTAKTVTVKTTSFDTIAALCAGLDSLCRCEACAASAPSSQATSCAPAATRTPTALRLRPTTLSPERFVTLREPLHRSMPDASTLVVKDLATKKTVTVHIPADAQMRRIPDRVAQASGGPAERYGRSGAGWQGGASAAGGQRGAAPGAPNTAPPGGGMPAAGGPAGGGANQRSRWTRRVRCTLGRPGRCGRRRSAAHAQHGSGDQSI